MAPSPRNVPSVNASLSPTLERSRLSHKRFFCMRCLTGRCVCHVVAAVSVFHTVLLRPSDISPRPASMTSSPPPIAAAGQDAAAAAGSS